MRPTLSVAPVDTVAPVSSRCTISPVFSGQSTFADFASGSGLAIDTIAPVLTGQAAFAWAAALAVKTGQTTLPHWATLAVHQRCDAHLGFTLNLSEPAFCFGNASRRRRHDRLGLPLEDQQLTMGFRNDPAERAL
ncbi:hypothetical protein GCM10011335_37310 [Aureimonas glaciei]|uniref:Uncharacterized protein n=1 Tax=Aureimonas glaciei TaxID=1776957 RepID=A0A916Y4E0_9HYPH|nr:hypothetical protein GCM10011335_37310 [Aureimonas glaciei]